MNELFRDGLGAVGARGSARFESTASGRLRALWIVYATGTLTIVLLGLCALNVERWFLPGLVAVGAVTGLQNLRRPMYVSELNDVSKTPLRATILSIDNQATSFVAALSMPLMGLAADRGGLAAICVLAALMLGFGLVLSRSNRDLN